MLTPSKSAFAAKIDLFMKMHVLPIVHPEEISWWFSLSGGKDSYAMALGLRDFYRRNGWQLDANAFHVDQWGGQATRFLNERLDWLKIEIIDARQLTQDMTGYQLGEQAPCRNCANARRTVTDALVFPIAERSNKLQFVARGLHLSDTAVSLLWRFVRGINPEVAMHQAGKGQPLIKIRSRVYLAKPLCYVREFESQTYAYENGFIHACCGCPACHIPSRRDVVEETVLGGIHTSLWEFDVPGMSDYLRRLGGKGLENRVKDASTSGIEQKRLHLPIDIGSFAVEYFRNKLSSPLPRHIMDMLDFSENLDEIGANRIKKHTNLLSFLKIPAPGILRKDWIPSHFEALMIASLGPFWGAIGLDSANAELAWRLQKELWGYVPDDNWTQIKDLLNIYYRVGNEHGMGTCCGVLGHTRSGNSNGHSRAYSYF